MPTDKVVACAQTREERDEFLDTLPKLSSAEVSPGDFCPICLDYFSAILEERAGQSTRKERSGVTRLQCGHIFCMPDIAVWIHSLRGSCPTCRDLFLVIPEPADDDSSDGGEYVPGSDSVADEMMDGETWSDEEGEVWTDSEDMSLDEAITEGETDSSWEISSERVVSTDPDEEGISAPGQLGQTLIDPTVIMNTEDGTPLMMPNADPESEHIKTELNQWRACIGRIRMQEWLTNEEGTRSRIHECICALGALKPRIDALERDTPAQISFVHSALAAMHEIHGLIEFKLEMMHDGGFVQSV